VHAWALLASGPASRKRLAQIKSVQGEGLLAWGADKLMDGGYLRVSAGALYSSERSSWEPISMDGAPSARLSESVTWTGEELIVWGGDDGKPFRDGAIYNPESDTWRAMTLKGAPSAHAADTSQRGPVTR
jgi:hypothetical protein